MSLDKNDNSICKAFNHATDKASKRAKQRAVDSCIYSIQQIAKRNDKEAFDEAVRRFC